MPGGLGCILGQVIYHLLVYVTVSRCALLREIDLLHGRCTERREINAKMQAKISFSLFDWVLQS